MKFTKLADIPWIGKKALYRSWLKNSGSLDDLERGKVRLILGFSLLASMVSFGYWLIHPVLLFNVPRELFLVLPVLLTFFCFLLLTSLHHWWVAQGVLFSFWFSFSYGAYYSGGIFSITIPWLALVPVLANFIINYRNSIAWFIACFVSILVFSLFPEHIPAMKYQEGPWRHMLSMTGLCLVMFFLTSLYVRSRNRILQFVQSKNEELLHQQKKLLNKTRR
jgi:hypothetical protein